MMKLHSFAVLGLLLLVSSCTSYSFGHRSTNTNPDERLAKLIRAYESSRKSNGENANEILVDAEAAWVEIERLALEFPRHPPTLMANAVIAYDERQPLKAKSYLDALFSVENSHPDGAVLRSRIAIDEGNMPLARRVLELQIAYTPYESAVHEAYSSVLYMSRDLEGAAREINLAEQHGAPAWRVAFNRGLIAEAMGRAADAQRYYQAALDGNPDFAPARARLAGQKAGS
ncbi:MAG: hypothetical protein JNL28_07700 [Planctomycetes bacterium]|nr:hypothetical protein [Planctomycetota bacterium]